MKLINEPIRVEASRRVPRRFRWNGRVYRVRKLLDYWVLQTRWWGPEEKRVYFRLETRRGVMEIYRASTFVTDAPGESGASSPAALRSAPPIVEGDTHTRELRRTDVPYRPDAAYRPRARSAAAERVHWILSKLLD